jgi:arsenical pump membrane protein
MFGFGAAHLLVSLIVGLSIALMLIRPRNIPEVYWISAGVLLLVLRLVSLRLVGRAAAKATDVCLFLIGMMLLSELAREHGVFDWLSSFACSGLRAYQEPGAGKLSLRSSGGPRGNAGNFSRAI